MSCLIPASSLKGSFADQWNHALETVGEGGSTKKIRGNSAAAWLFGSDDANNASAGALLFSEARVLAFPIRSARGSYAWIPLRLAHPGDLAHARSWLARGLEIFGLGAQTNAGYGWFDASDGLNDTISTTLSQEAEVKDLAMKHRDFDTWPTAAREDAVLMLSERKDICQAWQLIDSKTFEPVRKCAESLNMLLV